MEIKKVMACVDFSYITSKVLDMAAEIAKRFKAELEIVYVVEERMPRLAQEMLDLHTLYDEVRDTAQGRLEDSKEEIKKKFDVEVSYKILKGEPFEAILDYVEQAKPDVVVVGAHGKKGVKRILLGSVSEKIARKSPSNVIIVKG